MISIQIPTLTGFLRGLYPMGLYSDDKLLPFDVLEIAESNNYSIPQAPLDNGSSISDHIFKQPLQISVRGFVTNSNHKEFLDAIKSGQFNDKGFKVTGINNTIYDNMRCISVSTTQTTEILGGFIYTLQMQEVMLAGASSDAISSLKNAAFSKIKNLGNVSTFKRPTSILRKIF